MVGAVLSAIILRSNNHSAGLLFPAAPRDSDSSTAVLCDVVTCLPRIAWSNHPFRLSRVYDYCGRSYASIPAASLSAPGSQTQQVTRPE